MWSPLTKQQLTTSSAPVGEGTAGGAFFAKDEKPSNQGRADPTKPTYTWNVESRNQTRHPTIDTTRGFLLRKAWKGSDDFSDSITYISGRFKTIHDRLWIFACNSSHGLSSPIVYDNEAISITNLMKLGGRNEIDFFLFLMRVDTDCAHWIVIVPLILSFFMFFSKNIKKYNSCRSD